MTDLTKFIEAVEPVFRAANGDNDALIEILKSDKPLSPEIRYAMAAWLSGELNKRGRQRESLVSKLERTIRFLEAEAEYRQKAGELRRDGDLYGNAAELQHEIAKKHDLTENQFAEFLRMSESKKIVPEPEAGLAPVYAIWKARRK